mgnify:CR=1 FL=1
MLRKGMFLADRYEILEQIGTGGMSDVYRAKCHKLNRFVAIKVLKKEYSEDKTFVSKFRAEAQAAAGLTHPNIVNVYDVGDENGIYYIVMELVEGITLKKYIEKKGKIPYKEAVSIAIQVAKGMQAAHSHHIVHRDIKPQNIIISRDGKVKVTDFGIAKAASSSTITSSTMGSVHYISPEQARGGYSDERSDIYSFGITLFEMLTGTVPFDGDSTVSVAVQHIQEEIPKPSTVADGIPVSIDMIVLKCTQKKTERRYQDAAELIADLKKSLVAPDENFVKMMPVYNAPGQPETVQAAEESSENNDEQENQNSNESMAENKKDSEDIDDELLDDELLDDDDDEEDIDDENNDKLDKIFKWIGAGIIALIVIITIFVVAKLFIGGSSNKKEEETTTQAQTTTAASKEDASKKVSVPSVIGKTEEEAKTALNSLGLGYKATYQPSNTIPEGTVISQGTSSGTKVAKNTTITLSISSGPESSSVPNVVGQDQVGASSLLESAGFKVSVKQSYSDSVEQGKVISQSPSGSTTVSPGSTVTITVSQGKETKMVTVPNVVGMNSTDAQNTLTSLGLNYSIVETKDTNVEKGKVISTSPSAGQQVEEGTSVKIYVSKGQETTTAASGNGAGNNNSGSGNNTGNNSQQRAAGSN